MAAPSSYESNSREVRIGRILSDLHERRRRGEPINEELILAEHADLANDLRPHLATLQQLQSGESSLTRLLRQGILLPSSDPCYRATFGDYQIIDYIGHGGMGVVLKAFDEQLRRIVAIKLLRNDLADHELAKARFLREARAAAALSHPNIVSVFAVGEHDGSQFIAMEYVDGPSLSQVTRETGPLPAATIRTLFAQLLEGLAAAHGAGLIHRDIKSANLLLNNGRAESKDDNCGGVGTLKIADFGLARITNAQTRLTIGNQSFGTPEYMSPEQARGEQDVDHRTDLYSAGVVLYEMLTGRTPFRAHSSSAVIRQIVDVQPLEPRSIIASADPALSSLSMRLMAKRREDRLASATDALAVLNANRPITNWSKWRRRAVMGAACLIVLCAIAAVAWVSRSIGSAESATPPAKKRMSAARRDSLRLLQVMFEGEGDWRLLHVFSEPTIINGATVADVDGCGQMIAVAAIWPTEGEHNLFAFDAAGKSYWQMELSSDRDWPDCAPARGFAGIHVIAAPLDDTPGDELIAVASDANEYPTCISILDPRTNPPRVRGTFWNLGDISQDQVDITRVQVVQSFFEDGRPAIVVLGVNNKLDGFVERGETAPQFWTQWDMVPVVMILDPVEIMRLGECVGPPATDLLDLPRGGVYAYAFADLAFDTFVSEVPDAPGRRAPLLEEQGGISCVQPTRPTVADGSGPWFSVVIDSRRKDDGTTLLVDRNLNARFSVTTPTPGARSDDEWRAIWIPVVQEGRWLEPAGGTVRENSAYGSESPD